MSKKRVCPIFNMTWNSTDSVGATVKRFSRYWNIPIQRWHCSENNAGHATASTNRPQTSGEPSSRHTNATKPIVSETGSSTKTSGNFSSDNFSSHKSCFSSPEDTIKMCCFLHLERSRAENGNCRPLSTLLPHKTLTPLVLRDVAMRPQIKPKFNARSATVLKRSVLVSSRNHQKEKMCVGSVCWTITVRNP